MWVNSMQLNLKSVGVLLGLLLMLPVWAVDPTAAIKMRFSHSFPDVQITAIQPAAAPGWYVVQADGMSPVFMTGDARYMVQGDFVRFDGDQIVNLSDQVLQKQAVSSLAAVPATQEIIFPAKQHTRASVYVFTDIDCGYCRKLHSQIEGYNAEGIEVRYLAWPRTGPEGNVARRMGQVWCAQDRLHAITEAYLGHDVNKAATPACDSLIKKQYALGVSLGVDGTPAVYSVKGERLGGYLSPADMAQALGLSGH